MLEAETTLDISESSPVFAFESGRSRFAAVRLPQRAQDSDLKLRTFVGAPTIVDGMGGHTYFFPVVTFLDGGRNLLSVTSDERLVAECYGFGCTGTLVGVVRIPRGAELAVIHTLPAKIGQTYTGRMHSAGTTTVIGGAVVPVVPAGDAPVRARFSATGKVLLSLGGR